MAIHDAFMFLQRSRQEPRLRRNLEAVGERECSERLLALGKAEGFLFTVEELQAAFRHDWTMRWLRFTRDE